MRISCSSHEQSLPANSLVLGDEGGRGSLLASMTRSFRKIARQIRHLPGLKNLNFLWERVRQPYEKLLNQGGCGVEVDIGGAARVRMPADYANKHWEKYEPETMKVFVDWCKKNPGARILDVGSSVGLFTLAGLFAHPKNEVVAFDSDLASLNVLKDFCRLAPGNRLAVVRGLVTNAGCGWQLGEAVQKTQHSLAKLPTATPTTSTNYILMQNQDSQGVPRLSLDELMSGLGQDPRPVLLKIDVEGAEQLVIQGADKWIRKVRPTILLEVHSKFLPIFGHTVETLSGLLRGHGYQTQLFATDYQQHWLCEPVGY